MKQVIEPTESDLPVAIVVKKQEMIQLGLKYGLAGYETIKCSQQLDDLLNKFANGELH
ncbi:aspartyl-phosphate phosphatase Spo0E family protein [Virgibacillus ainsalahensis]